MAQLAHRRADIRICESNYIQADISPGAPDEELDVRRGAATVLALPWARVQA